MDQSSTPSFLRTPSPEPTPPHRAISPYLLHTSSPEDEVRSESLTSQHEVQTLNLAEYALHVASTTASIRGADRRFYNSPLVRACFEDESPTTNPLLRSPTLNEEAPPTFRNTNNETTPAPDNDERVSTRQGTSTKNTGSAKGSASLPEESVQRPQERLRPPILRAQAPAQAMQAQNVDSDHDLNAPAQPKPVPPDFMALQYKFAAPGTTPSS